VATEAEKEVLVEHLKFTPRTYVIQLWGYGGEVVMGRVDRKIYDYFKENQIDVGEYAYDWDNELEVPEDVQPFTPGEWHDCDHIVHESGIEMSGSCHVTVYDENGNEVWTHGLDTADLDEDEITVIESEEYFAHFEAPGTVVFYGQSFEKGTFMGGPIELTAPFDPTKLKFYYNDIEGWPLCSNVEYDNQDIDGLFDDYDTTGKSSDFYLWLVNEDGSLTGADE
jgi:hypothetical protein